jgi:hypothetical protein
MENPVEGFLDPLSLNDLTNRCSQPLADLIRHIQSLPLLRLQVLSANTLDSRRNCRRSHILKDNPSPDLVCRFTGL